MWNSFICGDAVCQNHVSGTYQLAAYGYSEPKTVCVPCITRLEGEAERKRQQADRGMSAEEYFIFALGEKYGFDAVEERKTIEAEADFHAACAVSLKSC